MTFASLPQADRDAFDQWKQRAIKDCAWEQALPSLAAAFPADGAPYAPTPWVDVHAFVAITGGSLVSGEAGALVLLDAPASDIGSASDARSARRMVDGQVRVLDVTAERQDGVCVIQLDGEELFRSTLAPSVPVIASYDGQPPATAGAALTPLIAGRAGSDEVAAIDSTALLAPVRAALVPTARAQGVLAKRFAINDDDARRVFPLRLARAADVVQLPAISGVTPFAPGARIFGAPASLAPIYAGSTVQTELLYDGLDADLVALRADVAVSAGGASVQLVAVTAGAHVAHDDAAARRCFTQRAAASRFEAPQPRSPAFDEQLAGCRHLAVDAFAALAADADTRRAIATMAIGPGVTPGAYRGWNDALIEVAQRVVGQGLALTELDPAGSLPLLATAIDRHAAIAAAITDPAVRATVREPIVALVLGWMFEAVTPSPALVAQIGPAVAQASGYPDSVRQMLADLGRGVDALDDGPRAVQCGLALVGDRRGRVDHAVASVATVPSSQRFASELRAEILQTCPSDAALASLETSSVAVTAFVAADRARASDPFGFQNDIEPVVDHALEQTWTASTFDALADLVAFAVISDATLCAQRSSLAERAVCVDPSLARFSAAPDDGVLAPAVAARYATLARELTARWPGLDDFDFATTRFDLTDAFRAGLWRACSDAGFDRAKQQLYTLIDALRAARDLDRRFDLETQIANLVTSRTCS